MALHKIRFHCNTQTTTTASYLAPAGAKSYCCTYPDRVRGRRVYRANERILS